MRRSLALALVSIGCGGGREVEPPPVLDVGPADAAIDTLPASGIPRCGPGPWLIHSERLLYGWGDAGPVVAAPVRVDECPELELKTDDDGFFRLAFTRGRPYDLLTAIPGLPKTWHGRFSGVVPMTLVTKFLESPAPAFDTETVGLSLQPYVDDALLPPCNNRLGIRARVPEYPGATTRYWLADRETSDPDDPAVVSITIDGLPPDVDVTVEASKPGCTVRPQFWYWVLPKVRTHAGHRTMVDVQVLGPDAMPDAGTDS